MTTNYHNLEIVTLPVDACEIQVCFYVLGVDFYNHYVH
jgi:hypothetical protein